MTSTEQKKEDSKTLDPLAISPSSYVLNSSNVYQFYEVYSHPFSKFYATKTPVIIDNKSYPTIEHFYQSSKFITTDPNKAEKIRNIGTTPFNIQQVHLLGQNDPDTRNDWFNVNTTIYYKGQLEKFKQNKQLKKQLLDTKNCIIVCIDTDTFWGIHVNQNDKIVGKNNAGILLMKIRKYLKSKINGEKKKEDLSDLSDEE